MNASTSNRPLLRWMFLLCLTFCLFRPTAAQGATHSEAPSEEVDTLLVERMANERYQQYVATLHRRWMHLLPNLGVLQYAGNIGMVSAGLGWDYGKNDRWETLFLVGYLPKFHADDEDYTFTLKENFVPWRVQCNEWFSFQPACFTLFVNTIFDDEFWTREPSRYPSSYYGFSSRVRFSIGFGGRINWDIPEARRLHGDRLSLYYELSMCDLQIVSAVPNREITFGDILRLGVGIQYKFF